jgi:hypothetical protein
MIQLTEAVNSGAIPGLSDAPLDHTALAVDQLRFEQAKQIAG